MDQSKWYFPVLLCVITTAVIGAVWYKNQLRVWLEYEPLPTAPISTHETMKPFEATSSASTDFKTPSTEKSATEVVQKTDKSDMIKGEQSPSASSTLVRINQMSATEWDALKGIGPVLAKRIIDDRRSNGPFKTLEDLGRVKGIGEKKLKNILESLK